MCIYFENLHPSDIADVMLWYYINTNHLLFLKVYFWLVYIFKLRWSLIFLLTNQLLASVPVTIIHNHAVNSSLLHIWSGVTTCHFLWSDDKTRVLHTCRSKGSEAMPELKFLGKPVYFWQPPHVNTVFKHPVALTYSFCIHVFLCQMQLLILSHFSITTCFGCTHPSPDAVYLANIDKYTLK
jgi:hypothetical protein